MTAADDRRTPTRICVDGVPMVFLDVETTGLGWHDPIWEIAAVRRVPGEPDREFQTFVVHDVAAAASLPEAFRADHDARYDPGVARYADAARDWLGRVAAPLGDRPPILLGAVPAFDASRLHVQLGFDPWHYRWVCVETMAWTALQLSRTTAGRRILLAGDPPRLPWRSDAVTEAIGVPQVSQGRHTALVDARWARDTFDVVMANVSETGGAVTGRVGPSSRQAW